MIVQCDKCQAKFRLDDSRVTEKGVKVRCSKCKNIFIVKKEEAVQAEVSPEPRPAEAAVTETPEGPAPPGEEAEEPLPSFEGFGGLGGEFATTPEKGPEEGEAAPSFETGEFPVFEEAEREGEGGESPGEDLTWGGLEGGEGAPEEEESFEAGPLADRGVGFEEEGAGIELETWEGEAPSFGMEGEGQEPSPAAEEEPSSTFGEFALEEEVREPAGELEVEERPAREAEPEREIPPSLEAEGKVTAAKPAVKEEKIAKPEKRSRAALLTTMLLLLIVSIGGGFYYLASTGKSIGGIDLQSVMENLRARISGAEAKRFDIGDLKGYYVQLEKEGLVFVIEGNAKNSFEKPRSFARFKGNLYDGSGKLIMTQEAYGGNIFSRDDLESYTRDRVMKEMDYKVGKGLANSNIQPGKEVRFMIVFYDAPGNLAEFDVETLGSEDVTE